MLVMFRAHGWLGIPIGITLLYPTTLFPYGVIHE